MSNQRAMDAFDVVMSRGNKISDGKYRATTAKRLSTIPPSGVMIYDTDEEIWYTGNGDSAGGVSEAGNKGVRIITVAAAASGTAQVTATDVGSNVLFTDTKFAQLRTGDGVTIADGTGTPPTGLAAAEYFVFKGNNQNSPQVSFASSRVNALAASGNYVSASGAPGWTTVISTVASDRSENVMYVKAAAATTVLAPYVAENEDEYSILIKKDDGAVDVTVSGMSTTGAATALPYNGTSGSIVLRTGEYDQVEMFLDTDDDEYITTHLINS